MRKTPVAKSCTEKTGVVNNAPNMGLAERRFAEGQKKELVENIQHTKQQSSIADRISSEQQSDASCVKSPLVETESVLPENKCSGLELDSPSVIGEATINNSVQSSTSSDKQLAEQQNLGRIMGTSSSITSSSAPLPPNNPPKTSDINGPLNNAVVVGTPTHSPWGSSPTAAHQSWHEGNHITTSPGGGDRNSGGGTTTIVATNSTIVLHTGGAGAGSFTAESLLRDFTDESREHGRFWGSQEHGITAIVGGPDNILLRRNSNAESVASDVGGALQKGEGGGALQKGEEEQ
eukprot:CAMPEP_0178990420 /NCGR_PEP_ID=MMETSP0795-20121207/4935_1 /TAXON_ID=88552 /ORGANISM="Amoebophrya sp., Strain Ameob2" /LENGTH=290 /DNA_ID=CAMNT_0020681961 /DNA_START=650 /DNA_END=1522 /DNA_ORIENTATION=+